MAEERLELPTAIKNQVAIRLDSLLNSRAYPKTICPSEVARQTTASELKDANFATWKDMMPEIRAIAWKKKLNGELEILQRGKPVNDACKPDEIRGPIRLRKICVA